MTIIPLSAHCYRIDENGETLSGIRIGSQAGRAVAQFTRLVDERPSLHGPGGERTGEWQPGGILVEAGELILTGPWLGSAVCMAELPGLPADTARPLLVAFMETALAQAASGLAGEGGLCPEAWFRLDDGRILVLGPAVQAFIQAHLSRAELGERQLPYQKPGLEALARLSYGFDVLAFQLMSGRLPIAADGDGELLQALQVAGVALTPACLDGTVPAAVELHYRTRFEGHVPGSMEPLAPSLAASLQSFQAWQAHHAPETPQADPKALAHFQRKQKRFRLRRTLQQHSGWIVAGVVGALILGLVVWTLLASVFRPPRTQGMAPAAVVSSFYQALDSLDSPLIGDCLAPSLAPSFQNWVEQLFLTTQVRAATERRTIRIPAAAWLAEGQPPLEPDLVLFGLDRLSIQALPPSAADPTPRFTAQYRLYNSLLSDIEPVQAARGMTVEITEWTDSLALASDDKGNWRIVSYERSAAPAPQRLVLPRPPKP